MSLQSTPSVKKEGKMLRAQCLCGSVDVTVDAQPDFVNDCNCSLCRKSGAAWGYYPESSVKITGKTNGYVRRDKVDPVVEVHSCPICCVTTHWTFTELFRQQGGVSNRLGVNMRLFSATDLYGVELRFPDGNSWNGEGDYGYRRPPFGMSITTPM